MTAAIDHKSRGHARFGASGSSRWFACPGSVVLCDTVPNRGSAAADEGTRAHELLETRLRMRQQSSDEWLLQAAPLGASDEMWAAVDVAVQFIVGILEDHPDAVMLLEHPFEIPVAAAPEEVWGTCDVVIFVPSLRLLYVIDYKHGAGVFVPVEGNKQLRFYGLGALAAIIGDKKVGAWDIGNDKAKIHLTIGTVALVIIQPRCPFGEPIREDWLPVETILEFGKEIGEAVTRAKAPDAPLVPGTEQCRFCSAVLVCPAREKQALAAAGESFKNVAAVGPAAMPQPQGITDEKIAEVLDAKDAVISWLEAVEAEGAKRLQAGGTIRGRKLVEAQARRQWVDEDPTAMAFKLADIFQPEGSCNTDICDLFTVLKLRGLTEIETLLKKGQSKEEARRRLDAMAFLTTKKSSGALKVAPESDPRPAVNRAASAFAGVAQIKYIKQET